MNATPRHGATSGDEGLRGNLPTEGTLALTLGVSTLKDAFV